MGDLLGIEVSWAESIAGLMLINFVGRAPYS